MPFEIGRYSSCWPLIPAAQLSRGGDWTTPQNLDAFNCNRWVASRRVCSRNSTRVRLFGRPPSGYDLSRPSFWVQFIIVGATPFCLRFYF